MRGLLIFVSLYILHNLFYCTYAQDRNIGEACTESSQCTAQNSQCTGSGTETCNCQNGYFTSGNSCLKRYLGQSCSTNTHCSLVTNGECSSSGICSCKSGYYQDGSGQVGRCKKRHLGESCTVDSQCSEANSVCRSNKCSCKSGYYQSGSGSTGTCTVRYLDQSCNSNSECQNTYSECRNNQCLCISGYYQTDTGRSGTCTRQALGEACTDASQCSTSSAQCSSGGNRICECRYGYYDTNGAGSGGSCSLQIQVGGICPQPTVSVLNTATCFDRNARCMSSGNSFTCQCISTYYDNQISNSRQCLPRRSLGDACNTPVNNLYQCSDSSATCTKENDVYKCKCNPGYHQEGIQCEANNALGNSCNAAIVGECSDPAANCLDSKCTCDTNSYDSNGFQNDGTCMPISYLQVTNVGFSSIQTDKITVSWTTPHNYRQYIDSFKVTWRATNANTVNTESANLDSTKTSYTLTRGIYHGRAYTVTIISINEQTQQGSQRTTFVVKYQAAKPAKTSGIDEIKSDKDVSGGTINVVWANALGYKSSFIVELKDGETVILTKTVGSIFATFSSSGLKHGYNYTITIQAKSEVYDTSKTELGEIFTTVFKTTPKRPGPPRNGVCNTPSDKSIDLFWDAPADPNGYLVRYIILVLKHGVTVFSNVSTTGTETNKTVENLVFGTTYTFRIYTVNEVGNTDSYLTVSSNCKTKAQINGGFTAWSAWTSCSLSCAGGSQTRSRTCTNPPPQYGGAQCTGQYSQSGQCNTQACQVPVNIEITLGVDVIPLRLLKDIERTKLTVTLLKGFFEESTNGDIVATGIVACVKDCNLESIKTAADFNKMSSWKQYGEQGSGFYRVTSPLWLDEIPTFCNNGRRKRSTKTIEYTVGSEYCMYVPTGEYCNGPLQPGTSYKLVAVVCNSGGCLLSRQYGPFTTVAAAQVTEECNCSTQSVVIGVVLGLIILILLVYAGYITVTIRRIRVKGGRDIMQGNKKRQISQTYVNETFGKGLSGVASGCTETEYSTLDDRSREDNTTYDILRPGLEK